MAKRKVVKEATGAVELTASKDEGTTTPSFDRYVFADTDFDKKKGVFDPESLQYSNFNGCIYVKKGMELPKTISILIPE